MQELWANFISAKVVVSWVVTEGAKYRDAVNDLRVVVGDDPRKHGILHEIVVWSPGQRVQTHQVLKVADLSTLLQPHIHDIREWLSQEYGLSGKTGPA